MVFVTQKMRNNITIKISDIELIDELKRVSKQIGKIELSQPEFKEKSKIHPTTISRRFGSWSKGLKVAGLKEVRHGRRHTEFEYFENLLNVWTHYGKQPSYGEMSIAPSKISANTYRKRFGTWYLSLQAFIEYINTDKPNVEQQIGKVQILEKKKTITAKEKRDISLGLRYKVLSKDRFKCVKCGNSPSTDITCKLHIDHILPFSKGGLTTFENLQTMCNNCNLGKGNRHNE